MIDVADLKRVKRQVRKATYAACRSTYRTNGGREYCDVYLDSPAPTTDYESMIQMRRDEEQRQFSLLRSMALI